MHARESRICRGLDPIWHLEIVLIPWGAEGTPNREHALMSSTVCSLQQGHHSESVAPILALEE